MEQWTFKSFTSHYVFCFGLFYFTREGLLILWIFDYDGTRLVGLIWNGVIHPWFRSVLLIDSGLNLLRVFQIRAYIQSSAFKCCFWLYCAWWFYFGRLWLICWGMNYKVMVFYFCFTRWAPTESLSRGDYSNKGYRAVLLTSVILKNKGRIHQAIASPMRTVRLIESMHGVRFAVVSEFSPLCDSYPAKITQVIKSFFIFKKFPSLLYHWSLFPIF